MNVLNIFNEELRRIEAANMYKYETPLESAQGGTVTVNRKKMVMLASNNYLGMSNHPKVKRAAIEGIKKYGYGLASVRFICGTQTIHLELEKRISKFLNTEDTILFSSAFSANEGFFASLTNEKLGFEEYKDVIYSDRLNHASIIDGQRLCRPEFTEKKIFDHLDADQLEKMLEEDKDKSYRFRIIATDGVFSMEGDLAPLSRLVELAQKYNAILFMDDCHGIGVCGRTGRGTAEHYNVLGKVTITSGTLGKAIGGATGGYISGPKGIITYLRQKSRPYTFSNSIPPSVVYASIKAFGLLSNDNSIVERLHKNTDYFRREIKRLGFTILEGTHPIVPVMVGEAEIAQKMSIELLKKNIYVKGLWFPVVPRGEARLRVQISASHKKNELDKSLDAFNKVGKEMGVIY